MDAVRQDVSCREQNYDFPIGELDGWRINYKEFDYPEESDKPRGAVKVSLLIEKSFPNKSPRQFIPFTNELEGFQGFFTDVIFMGFDEKISRYSDNIAFSPAIRMFKGLDETTRAEIYRALSDEARTLLERGIEGYMGS